MPIQYSIRGQDLSALQNYAKQITSEFSKLPGIVDVDTSLEVGQTGIKVYIDRDRAADLGVDVATVAEAINLLIGGELDIARYKDEQKGKRYDIRVRLNPEERESAAPCSAFMCAPAMENSLNWPMWSRWRKEPAPVSSTALTGREPLLYLLLWKENHGRGQR